VILAIDDNLDNLVLLEYQLSCLKQRSFITATTGKDALTLAEHQNPDLILLDIHLPDIDGVEVVRKLRKCPLTANIPIVAVTALARREDRDRILASGCDDYLSKPYDLDELEAIIHRHLSQNCPL
jgi:CheY-like chemotaxis protein